MESGRGVESIGPRVRGWIHSLPAVTRSIVGLCVLIHIGVLLGLTSYGSICLSPILTVYNFQMFRIVTHGVFHLNLLHLGFNMAAFYPIGTRMEQAGGSLHLAWTIGVLLLGSGLLSLAVSIGIMYTVGLPSLMFHCDVGFSGVIFGLMIMQAMRLPPGRKTSFFGIDIPSRVYPVVLLVVIQFLLPRSVSLLGHLSGLAMGYILCTGPGSILIPSSLTMASLDSSRIVSALASCAGSSWVSAENANGFSYVAGSGSPSVLPTTTPTPQPYSATTSTSTTNTTAASSVQNEPKFPGEGRVVGE